MGSVRDLSRMCVYKAEKLICVVLALGGVVMARAALWECGSLNPAAQWERLFSFCFSTWPHVADGGCATSWGGGATSCRRAK